MAKSARELREQKAALRVLLANGATEYECMDELGFTSLSSLRKLRQNLLSDELEEVHDESAAALYVRYKLRMDGCISDLDEVIKMGKEKHNSLNSVVGAVKAKAGIIDNVIQRGQDLGVLPIVAAAPSETGKETKELKASVAELHDELRAMVREYGGASYSDEPDEDIYLDLEDDEPVVVKAKKARAS